MGLPQMWHFVCPLEQAIIVILPSGLELILQGILYPSTIFI